MKFLIYKRAEHNFWMKSREKGLTDMKKNTHYCRIFLIHSKFKKKNKKIFKIDKEN